MQASYHTLVGIAMELLDALESAIAGRMVSPLISRVWGGGGGKYFQGPPLIETLLYNITPHCVS